MYLYAANTTLTADKAGGFISAFNNTGPITLTLPLLNSVVAGATFCSLNSSAYPVTIVRQGTTDTINLAMVTQTSVVLQSGDTLNLSLLNTVWECFGGSAQLRYMGGFAALLTTNGYQKLPSGLIFQWGNAQNIPIDANQ